jgi:hypothetical protein
VTTTTPIHDAILGAWECAFAGSPVCYLSGPITTGLRKVERLRSSLGSYGDDGAVLRENSDALIATAKRLRAERRITIIEPATLTIPEWSQADYLALWEALIERHVGLIIFMPDWEYSIGCAIEFARAMAHDVRTETVSGAPITVEDGIALLSAACDDLRADDANGALAQLADRLGEVVRRLSAALVPASALSAPLRKDASLDRLAERGFNVAQFVSFSPQGGAPRQEFARIAGQSPNTDQNGLRNAVETLLQASPERSVNVRSYEPFNPQSREFIYGLTDVSAAVAAVERLTAQGLHTIVNETVDVSDGGVSGVLMGNVLEFAPDDTPRCVEKPGVASLPRGWGRELLSTVYGFPVELPVPMASRIEFSLHPRPRGWQQTNILTWEFAEQGHVEAKPSLDWPNRFSRMVGDKVFGLLVAHHLGLPVPRTTVINRRLATFSFGRSTGWGERWIRTAPVDQVPGKFTTHRGWIDPFRLIQAEDESGEAIMSVLSQEGIRTLYSGALIVGASGDLILEGKAGEGESLMLGTSAPEELPAGVAHEVRRLFDHASAALGPVRLEWVFDGDRAWVVQLHRGATDTDALRLTKGEASRWVSFDVEQGLDALRTLIGKLPEGSGLALKGRVGLTSHIADVIRKSMIPARMDG